MIGKSSSTLPLQASTPAGQPAAGVNGHPVTQAQPNARRFPPLHVHIHEFTRYLDGRDLAALTATSHELRRTVRAYAPNRALLDAMALPLPDEGYARLVAQDHVIQANAARFGLVAVSHSQRDNAARAMTTALLKLFNTPIDTAQEALGLIAQVLDHTNKFREALQSRLEDSEAVIFERLVQVFSGTHNFSHAPGTPGQQIDAIRQLLTDQETPGSDAGRSQTDRIMELLRGAELLPANMTLEEAGNKWSEVHEALRVWGVAAERGADRSQRREAYETIAVEMAEILHWGGDPHAIAAQVVALAERLEPLDPLIWQQTWRMVNFNMYRHEMTEDAINSIHQALSALSALDPVPMAIASYADAFKALLTRLSEARRTQEAWTYEVLETIDRLGSEETEFPWASLQDRNEELCAHLELRLHLEWAISLLIPERRNELYSRLIACPSPPDIQLLRLLRELLSPDDQDQGTQLDEVD